ncbi:hypothetical protein PENTCL1PPCAC_16176, partial [Pristionchus entomophagus]
VSSNSGIPAQNSLATWMFVSQLQYWVVLVVVLLTLPLIIVGLLRLRHIRRSHYYHFLMGICVANLVSLSTVLFDVVMPTFYPSIKGNLTCKVTPFLMNVAACFANWTFVVMFAQRFAVLLFPLKQMMQQGCIGFLLDARRLLAVVLLFSIATQSWALLLMTQREYRSGQEGSMVICETDPTRIEPSTATWISVLEMSSTYLLPFICTLIVDLGVLVWSKHFTTKFNETVVSRSTHTTSTGRAASHMVLFRGMSNASQAKPARKKSSGEQESGMKIQTAEHVRTCNKKRGKAIRRCLMMATAQVLINLPYHTLQVFDEFYDFASDEEWFTFYFYADALMYLIYLLQYPAVLVHIEFLISDNARNKKKSPLIPASRNTSVKPRSRS